MNFYYNFIFVAFACKNIVLVIYNYPDSLDCTGVYAVVVCDVCVQVCQKVGEISLLKQQLRESQGEVTQRAGEMVALRGQLKELNAQLREREEAEISLKESFCTKTLELERCEAELQTMLAEVPTLNLKASLQHRNYVRCEMCICSGD